MVNVQNEIQAKLTKGLLDPIILQLLDEHPMYGYEIMKTIRKSYGVYLGASTLYPTLNTLEKKRLVKSEWNMHTERPRKVYRLTNDGQAILHYSVGSLNRICKTIDNVNKNVDKRVEIGMIVE